MVLDDLAPDGISSAMIPWNLPCIPNRRSYPPLYDEKAAIFYSPLVLPQVELLS